MSINVKPLNFLFEKMLFIFFLLNNFEKFDSLVVV